MLNKLMFSIYKDFQKAFDRVDHTILLRKLVNFVFSLTLIKMLESYLDRPHFIEYEVLHLRFILPDQFILAQGSSLGSLLFILFIN